TELATVDVSDPSAPAVTHRVEYDSDLVTARLQDGVVRVVLEAGLPDLHFTEPGRNTTAHEAIQANREAVRHSRIEDWLPNGSLGQRPGRGHRPRLRLDGPALPCDQPGPPGHGARLFRLHRALPPAPAAERPVRLARWRRQRGRPVRRSVRVHRPRQSHLRVR